MCGGATEGNNQILRTHAAFAEQKLGRKPHIVCSSVEHPSVIEVVDAACLQLGVAPTGSLQEKGDACWRAMEG